MNKHNTIINYRIIALRIFFGAVFILSGIIKMTDFNAFRDALYEFKMLDNTLLNILTYLIPSLEIILGSALVLNLFTNLVSQVTTFMVALFTAVVVSKIYEGEKISCGCFGNLSSGAIDVTTVIRNIILIVLGILITSYYTQIEDKKEDKPKESPIQTYLGKMLENKFIRNFKNVFIITLFFFMAVQLIIFSLQNEGLKSRLDFFTTDQEVLQNGEEVKPFYAYDLKANRSYISFVENNAGGTLILLFSSKCEPCKMNLPNWKYLINSVWKNSVSILGLAYDSVNVIQNYAKMQNLNFPIYSFNDQDIKIKLKGFITPQTISIDNKGKVLKTWAGILNAIRVKDVIENVNSIVKF